MKTSLRLAAATFVLSFATAAHAAADPGYVDLGRFQAAQGCEFVEVNLHAPLLKLASLFAGEQEPETAALIKSLKHVRVNVVGFDDATESDTLGRVTKVRRELESQGWAQMVTVQEAGKREDIAIYVKTNQDDSIDGLVVTVIDAGKREVVFVNVVGNIKPEQIAALGTSLRINGMPRFAIAGDAPRS